MTPVPAVPAPRTVLLLEPDGSLRRTLRVALERAGWRVEEDPTADGDARAIVAWHGSDRRELQRVRRSHRGVPLLLLAERLTPAAAATAMELGAAAVLDRRVAPSELALAVAAHLPPPAPPRRRRRRG